MSAKIRKYRRGGWEVDVTARLPDGTEIRERRKARVSSKSAAQRWGEERERHLSLHGRPEPKKEVPTLAQFAPRFLEGHARANQQKPSGVVAKESILRVHLIPLFGDKRLDEITTEQVLGEMIGLEWRDVDFAKRQLCVQRSDWRGHITVPKGGRLRYVGMTVRLAAALKEHRHLRSARIICQPDGSPLTQWMVRDQVERAARKGNVPMKGVHHLRHTFCSHLAMQEHLRGQSRNSLGIRICEPPSGICI